MSVAIITGASRGLGRAAAQALADRGWDLIIDGRDGAALDAAATELANLAITRRDESPATQRLTPGSVHPVAGDVSDPQHRASLFKLVERLGRLDLLINNASLLGPSPQPQLAHYPLDVLSRVLEVNVVAPLALSQLALPWLQASTGVLINVTSDAGVEAYPGWGGYGSSKAALEHVTRTLVEENPELGIYLADPGDLRTQMHQEAFPGEDISDRPLPQVAVPGLLTLAQGRLPSGRYRLQDLGGPLDDVARAGMVGLVNDRRVPEATVA